MNERAIDKMVEWLENNMEDIGNGIAPKDILFEAMRLAAEEAKVKPTREELLTILSAWESVFGTSQLSHASARLQAAEDKVKRLEFQIAHPEKPTAPASFYTDIKKWRELFNVNIGFWGMKELDKILSRYRPSTQADIVGQLKELVKNTKSQEEIIEVWQIEEIIRKHEGDKW